MRIFNFLFALTAFLFVMFGCNARNSGIAESIIHTDSVTLIFNNIPKDPGDLITTRIDDSFFSYMDADTLPSFRDREIISGDTITLATMDGYLEVALLFRKIQHIYFYLKGGDTVTFSYNHLVRPVAESAMSPNLTRQYNFVENIAGATSNARFNLLGFGLKIDSAVMAWRDFIPNFGKALEEATSILDPIYLDYYTYLYKIEQGVFISTCQPLRPGLTGDGLQYEDIPLNDSLTKYISYYYHNPVTKTQNARSESDIFKSMTTDNTLPPKSRMLALYKYLYLWNIPGFTYKGPDQIQPYYTSFLSATKDTAALEKLKKEFELFYVAPEDINTGDLILVDTNDVTTTLESLLDKHKGKVVYMDFWASWCAPCIGNMPSALTLREEYKDKDVVFIYLALNDNLERWKEAVKTHKTDYLGHNYFIINSESADIIQKLKIRAIPRYVIFDKEGKIVNPEAPRSSQSKEIREELNKYM